MLRPLLSDDEHVFLFIFQETIHIITIFNFGRIRLVFYQTVRSLPTVVDYIPSSQVKCASFANHAYKISRGINIGIKP